MYSKFSFGEVFRRIYCRKFSFTVTREFIEKHGHLVVRLVSKGNQSFNLVTMFCRGIIKTLL